MKKVICILNAFLLAILCVVPAFADADFDTKTLSFNEDGTFKLLVINDWQDTDETAERSVKLLRATLQQENPDLIVFNGDQLCDKFSGASVEKFKVAIANMLQPIDEYGVPFLFTFGNHDCDKKDIATLDEQASIYYAYAGCFAEKDGPDAGTYNKVIMSSDGTHPALNIYMMNTNDWTWLGMEGGVTSEQVQWYKNKSDELKTVNGGSVVPAVVFQHVPIKEMYSLLKIVSPGTSGAIQGHMDGNYYVLDESKMLPGDNVLKSSIYSENPNRTTGEYESWLEKGDVFAAFFAHDHNQNFVGRTDDGIILGYNRGFGFGTFGDGTKRGGRIIVFDENDMENFEFYNVTYEEMFPDEEKEGTQVSIGATILAKIVAMFMRFINLFTGSC